MYINIWMCIVMLTLLVRCHLLSLDLKKCEDFADDHDRIFKASKSQLLYFSSCYFTSNNCIEKIQRKKHDIVITLVLQEGYTFIIYKYKNSISNESVFKY